MNIIDIPFVRGDFLMQKNRDEKSAPFIAEARDISNQENPAHSEENQSSEMSKVSSVLQMDSKALATSKEIKSNCTNGQVSKVSSASNIASPRRKISVYCRSFDVVAVQDSREDQGSNLEVRQSQNNLDNSSTQINKIIDWEQNVMMKYHGYRNRKGKQFQDSLLDDESPIEQTIFRMVHLVPTSLKFPSKIRNELHRTTEDLNYASPVLVSSDLDDSAKIMDSEDPHSQTCVQRVDGESQSRIERSVDSQMSSREDSLAVSSNGVRESGFDDRCSTDEKVANEIGKTVNVAPSASLIDPISTKVIPCKNTTQSDGKARERNLRMKSQLSSNTKRSYSDDENFDRLECHCKRKSVSLIPQDRQHEVFPSLTDIRLQNFGIANLSDTELEIRENSSEFELQKKYTAFSLCLCIDRLTLPRRIAMSLRQRDQSEKNLSYEVRKMQQDIQELAPLCMDRESMERVERVRHQLDMIVRCAHRVSCTAETLGAVHQEHRISRAVLLADKYLQVLHSRCEKLIANVIETKRILIENNIMEENSGELNDELPCIRYRSNTTVNNRMMMAKRRASVATMSRPIGNTQDITKDIVKQRNSVSGRMILRKPSFSSEFSKWDIEKLDRAESSNSINELRGIFEQVESCHNLREENNNMLRLNHSNSQSTVNCAITNNEDWTNIKEEVSSEISDNESINSENKSSAKSSHSFQLRRRKRTILSTRHMILSSILIFFFVFYMIHAMSLNVCQVPLNKWSDMFSINAVIHKKRGLIQCDFLAQSG